MDRHRQKMSRQFPFLLPTRKRAVSVALWAMHAAPTWPPRNYSLLRNDIYRLNFATMSGEKVVYEVSHHRMRATRTTVYNAT